MINTVTGAIQSTQLGKTLIHEHIQFGYPGFQGDQTIGKWDRAKAMEAIRPHIEGAKANGVQSIVDATPNECGRDAGFLKEVSEELGIQIVCSTGFYYEGEGGTAYYKFRSAFTDIVEEIFEMMMHEITIGIGDTGVKAGVIKLATSKDIITDYEKAFFTAGARAAIATNTPIITHTQEGTMGPDQAKLLTELGVNPNKIMIGHMGGSMDIDYHVATFKHGVRVAFDRCGLQMLGGMPMDTERIDLFSRLVKKGFGDRLHLSHDFILNMLGRPIPEVPELGPVLANYHLGNIFENIIPGLVEKGISMEQVNKVLIDNPRSLFE